MNTKHIGQIRIVDGTPVPFAATVQRQRAADGVWESIDASGWRRDIGYWLVLHHPGSVVSRIEGAYFHYYPES